MKGFAYFYKPIVKRPEILAVFSVITFLYCVVEYNFVLPVIYGISTIKTGNMLDSVMHLIQMTTNYIINIKPLSLVYIIAVMFLISLAAGFFSAIYFYVLNASFVRAKKEKGELIKGIKKHFVKLSLMSFIVFLISILFILFMVVVSVPAIVVTRAALMEKPELLLVAGVFDIITLSILFFGLMFFRIYMFFWYPAAINFGKKAFSRGKRAADASFWRIVSGFIMFDLVFVALQFALVYVNSYLAGQDNGYAAVMRIIVLLLLNWVFKTILFTSLIIYIFSKFLSYWKKPKDIVK